MAVQKPVKSGFDASSTATDVLKGLDLSGKTAFITGGHSGLGFEATKALSTAGVHVVVGARDYELELITDFSNLHQCIMPIKHPMYPARLNHKNGLVRPDRLILVNSLMGARPSFLITTSFAP